MDKLIEIIENYSEYDNINGKTEFKEDLGLSSFDTVCMIEEIEGVFGVKLTPKDFTRYKTVQEMAEYIKSV